MFERSVIKLWKKTLKFDEILKKNWENSETVFERHVLEKCSEMWIIKKL